jgi:hypothetical protein
MNGTRVVRSGALVAVLVAVAGCSKSSGSGGTTNGSTSKSNASAAASVSRDSLPAGADQESMKSSSGGRRVVLFAGTSLTAGLGLEPDSAYPMLIQRKIDSAGLPFDVALPAQRQWGIDPAVRDHSVRLAENLAVW